MQEPETHDGFTVRPRRVVKPVQPPKDPKVAGLPKPPKPIAKVRNLYIMMYGLVLAKWLVYFIRAIPWIIVCDQNPCYRIS